MAGYQVLSGLDICSLDIKSDLAGHDFRYMTLLTVEKVVQKRWVTKPSLTPRPDRKAARVRNVTLACAFYVPLVKGWGVGRLFIY